MPKETGMRPILGIVTILFGIYRSATFFLVPPEKRRPYGGFRTKPWEKENETTTENNESKPM